MNKRSTTPRRRVRRRLQSVVVRSDEMQLLHENGLDFLKLHVSVADMLRICEQSGDLHSVRVHIRRHNAGGQIPPASGGNLDRLVGNSVSGEQRKEQ